MLKFGEVIVKVMINEQNVGKMSSYKVVKG